MTTKIAAVIPARLASTRFPRKVLYPFKGIPMVEHVRRRALLVKGFSEVIVAACDEEVKKTIEGFGGRVVMTSDKHPTGTDRVAEVVQKLDCTHVVVLQGDEPLILPSEVEAAVLQVQSRPEVKVWNGISPLDHVSDLDTRSIVKCVKALSGEILLMFRKSPFIGDPTNQLKFVRKVLGFIAYRREFISEFSAFGLSPIEASESIEQNRILENGLALQSLWFDADFPSVNLPEEAEIVERCLNKDLKQMELLQRTLG